MSQITKTNIRQTIEFYQQNIIPFSKKIEYKLKSICSVNSTDLITQVPLSFRTIFSLYNYFTIDVEYNDGKFEWYNYVDEKLISLNNHKQYDAEKDIDLFIAELLKTMKTRIPAKYLKFYEKKGFYSSKTWMD